MPYPQPWRSLHGSKDIFRLNCSHRRGGDFERVYPLIRRSADRMVGIEWGIQHQSMANNNNA